jgi:hypothetical protein
MARLVASLCILAMAVGVPCSSAEVIDFTSTAGRIKPVNGIGQPPMVGQLTSWNLMYYLKEAGILCTYEEVVLPQEIAPESFWLVELEQ